MDCPKIKEDLKAFLDGELPAENAKEMRRHIDSCEVCKRELESASAFDGALKNIFLDCKSKGNADFIEALPAYSHGRIHTRRRLSIFRLSAAAVLALAVGLVVFLSMRAPVQGFQVESGDAMLNGPSEVKNLSTVSRLLDGQHFSVLAGEPLSLRSEGGSVIKFDPSTEAKVRSVGGAQLALELVNGRVHVQSSDKDSFAIHAAGGVTEFSGGECRVEKENESEAVVIVFRGSAKLSNRQGSLICEAGKIASLTPQKSPEFTARSIVPPGVLKRELKIFQHLHLAKSPADTNTDLVVRSLQDWNDLWVSLLTDEKLPAVNFATEMVVFVARQGNNSVQISSVSEIGKQLYVTVSAKNIPEDSNPIKYDLVIVERSTFPASFEDNNN